MGQVKDLSEDECNFVTNYDGIRLTFLQRENLFKPIMTTGPVSPGCCPDDIY